MINVIPHFKRYGPRGVPNGFVETQKVVKGNTPCLRTVSTGSLLETIKTHRPISRIILDCPIRTANRFPKALSNTRTFRAVSAPPVPKTVVKKTPAAISSDSANSFLGTVQKLVRILTFLTSAITYQQQNMQYCKACRELQPQAGTRSRVS